MKLLLSVCISLFSLSSHASKVGLGHIKARVCQELKQQQFEVDGGCKTGLILTRNGQVTVTFKAQNLSGDCDATIVVDKRNLAVKSEITCQ